MLTTRTVRTKRDPALPRRVPRDQPKISTRGLPRAVPNIHHSHPILNRPEKPTVMETIVKKGRQHTSSFEEEMDAMETASGWIRDHPQYHKILICSLGVAIFEY